MNDGGKTRAVEARKAKMETRERTYSVGCLTDWVQKKGAPEKKLTERDAETQAEKEEEGAFEKSNKVIRSPARRKRKVGERDNREGEEDPTEEEEEEAECQKSHIEAILEEILKRMRVIENQNKQRAKDKEEIMDKIKEEIRVMGVEFNLKQEKYEKELRDMQKELKEAKRRLEEMEKKTKMNKGEEIMTKETTYVEGRLRELEMAQERKDRSERKNNIVIMGAEINRQGNKEIEIKRILKELVGKEIEIERTQEIGGGERKLVVVKLKSWAEKREVMEKKSKLKGKETYINDDLTKKEREVQKKIREVVKEERGKGHQAKMGYMKMQIDGKWKKWNELKEEFEEIRDFRFGARK